MIALNSDNPMTYKPHEYQREASRFQLQRQLWKGEPGVGFFLDPGLGKTSISLLGLSVFRNLGLSKKTMIFAPKRVVHSVWRQEAEGWQQFRGLRFALVSGTEKQRINALRSDADVYLANTDVCHWVVRYWLAQSSDKVPVRDVCRLLRRMRLRRLADEVSRTGDRWAAMFGWADNDGEKRKPVPPKQIFTYAKNLGLTIPSDFTDLIVDESSQYKTPGTRRFQSLSAVSNQFQRVSILTGTPSPNGLIDLWSQIYLLDRGEALGSSFEKYKRRWFTPANEFRSSWIPKPGAEKEIYDAIRHLVIRLSAEDHLDLPELVVNDFWVDLKPGTLKKYKKLERELFVELASGGDLMFDSTGARYGCCRGFANGGLYEKLEETDERRTHHFHEEKIEPLKELIGELQGKPLMIAYPFQHDLDRIRKHFPDVPAINGDTSGPEGDRLAVEWNAGRLPLLCAQPASLSHGLNMQSGGLDMCWFGLTDNLEHYQQLIRRIHRQGVRGQVRIHRILARHTVDEAIAERLDGKAESQQALLDALNNYRQRETER